MNKNKRVMYACVIGIMCSLSYTTVYMARNLLSAVTPQIVGEAGMTNEYIGTISSLYFAFYAVGQLINGLLGEKIKGKYMVGCGLFFGGIFNILFLTYIDRGAIASLLYGMLGFCLSMVYAPMAKLIAENTETAHAQKCCLGLEFAALFGAPIAGLIAGLCAWRQAFGFVSTFLFVMGTTFFVVFSVLEKKGAVKHNPYAEKTEKKKAGGIRILIKNRIILFTVIAALTGIVRTAVVFWLPTYIAQYLGFSAKTSAFLYSAATIAISVTAFLAMFVYERLHRNMDLTILLAFMFATVAFGALYFVKIPFLNVALIVLAVIASNCASAMIWVVYCPGLRDTGMVSTAAGYLDCICYFAGAVSNVIFANAVSAIGWRNLILVWAALMGIGAVITLPKKKLGKW